MDVKLPHLGEGADSGTVVSVLVKPGAPVKKGQNIIELETGKAVAPIPSPKDGVVSRLAVKEGDKLSVGGLILVLETGATGTPTRSEPTGEADRESKSSKAAPPTGRKRPTPEPPADSGPGPDRGSPPPVHHEAPGAEEVSDDGESLEAVINESPSAGPYVRRVARDLGLDLRHVAGSGRSGQIMVTDLKAHVGRLRELALRPRPARVAAATPAPTPAKTPAAVPDFAQWGPVTRKPMSLLRRTIAARMVESATTLPTVTQFDEADVTDLDGLRRKYAAVYEGKGGRLTMTSFFVRAIAKLLEKHPLLNASLDEASNEIVLKEYVHLGLAVDTEAGLLVPVIRDANRKDLLTLSREIQEVAGKARDRKLGLAEMQGGSFTLSNQGGIGGAHFTPIVNKPEVAILGLGRGAPKPVIREGQIVPRLMLPLALTYDHRLIDGGTAARFMVDLVGSLQGYPEDEVRI